MKFGFKKSDIFVYVTQNNHNLVPLIFGSIIIGAATGMVDASFKDGNFHPFWNIFLS